MMAESRPARARGSARTRAGRSSFSSPPTRNRSTPRSRRPGSSLLRASSGRKRPWLRSAISSAGTPVRKPPWRAVWPASTRIRAAHLKGLDELYASRCRTLGLEVEKAVPTKDEVRLAGLVRSGPIRWAA